jgi:hypothetical protein
MKLPRRVFLHLILHLSTRKFYSDNRDHLYRWCARTRHPKSAPSGAPSGVVVGGGRYHHAVHRSARCLALNNAPGSVKTPNFVTAQFETFASVDVETTRCQFSSITACWSRRPARYQENGMKPVGAVTDAPFPRFVPKHVTNF